LANGDGSVTKRLLGIPVQSTYGVEDTKKCEVALSAKR